MDRVLIRSKAPLRLSFAGGGTDVSPYCDLRGGAVLSTTIDRHAYCTIIPRDDKDIRIMSQDYGKVEEWRATGPLDYDGNLDLVKAVLNHFQVDRGFDMLVHTDAPPGSGLGGSSTVIVSIIGAVAEWLSIPLSQYEIARLAYVLEREELELQGGKQDQYAATFGGFNFMEFRNEDTVVTPLRVKDDVVNELHYNFLLCYTGRTRDSGNIIVDQSENVRRGENEVMTALDGAKGLALEMRHSLMKGDIVHMGELLHQGWEHKKRFTGAVTNERIDLLYRTARESGAIGGKISGAGGGGYMFFICANATKHIVARELERLGAEVSRFNFEESGLQTWRYRA